MKKTKILIINKNMIAGGIESSLLAFINHLKDSAEIDLMLFNKVGALLDRVPKDINIITGGKILRSLSADYQNNSNQIGSGKIGLKRKLINIAKKLGAKKVMSWFAFCGQKIEKDYDVVIAMNGMDELCSKFALKCCKADKKFNFIHCDIRNYNLSKKRLKELSNFNKVIMVSKSCYEVFNEKYPQLSEKTDWLYNFTNTEEIIKMSNEFKVSYDDSLLNIVSVSRLSPEKAHLRSLEVFKKLHNNGYKFKWHVLGDGDSLYEIKQFIDKNNMKDYVELYGNKQNPQPYIKSADLFYLGSYHESAGLVMIESMTLNVPVLTTKTCSAKEFVGDYGFICENEELDIYEQFKEIFNRNLLNLKRENLKAYKYPNDEIKTKFLSWI